LRALREACEVINSAKNFCGIFICSDGMATSIYANRFKGIRAGLYHTADRVRQGREHNDLNALCLAGEEFYDGPKVTIEKVKPIINAFLNTKALCETRYVKRRELFDKI
jgi:ribose 5-phosphate isomerase B